MKTTAGFNARAVRDSLLARVVVPDEAGFHPLCPIGHSIPAGCIGKADGEVCLIEKRADYHPHVFDGNLWLSAAQHLRKGAEANRKTVSRGTLLRHLRRQLIEQRFYRVSFPSWLRDDGLGTAGKHGNAAPTCQERLQGAILKHLSASVEDLFSPRSRHSPRSRLPRCQCWGAYAWAGRAFRFQAGLTETPPRRLKPLPAPPHVDANWQPCLISDNPGARCHDRNLTPGGRRHCSSRHGGRAQHGR